ncbi:HlyD family secretion protein [Cyclobacterium plantarum]|uniref:HlyD family efflux transporter periplasmic adaptor subunit n=1 Tax=Cyclobacterium plantarum TaxID=2716263 RepID=A0ABX0HE58_9BACT|nr:HlyD family efflux transporter periplasmic adaptor subunit [Cyclobacterium plantarum]NHE58624.1 HlyD family efflux transporter periplasmic adaptor subunit [Cyclobacterium plantarum]
MDSRIFPAAIASLTVEVFDARISVRSKVIYLIILAILVLSGISMFFVHVDVAVQSRGTFQSALQRNPLMSAVGGRLESWNLAENKKVFKGEVLAVIRKEVLNLEMEGLKERLSLLEDFISDLEQLLIQDLPASSLQPIALRTHFFQASLLEYQTQIANQTAAVQKLERDYTRANTLLKSKTLAFADFDEVEVEYKQANAQLELIQKQKIHKWEQELNNFRNEKIKVSNQLKVYKEQMDQYNIVAGTNGTLINVLNLNKGDFIHPQQKLAEISPDTTLQAVIYISPADIAFIQKGQQVSFQVDAYNYNQWGIAKGTVLDVADDLTLLNEKEVGYLVTCILDRPFLTLSNGVEGHVKKGMTFNARFIVARRTLSQLLYDNVNDWINPMVNNKP